MSHQPSAMLVRLVFILLLCLAGGNVQGCELAEIGCDQSGVVICEEDLCAGYPDLSICPQYEVDEICTSVFRLQFSYSLKDGAAASEAFQLLRKSPDNEVLKRLHSDQPDTALWITSLQQYPYTLAGPYAIRVYIAERRFVRDVIGLFHDISNLLGSESAHVLQYDSKSVLPSLNGISISPETPLVGQQITISAVYNSIPARRTVKSWRADGESTSFDVQDDLIGLKTHRSRITIPASDSRSEMSGEYELVFYQQTYQNEAFTERQVVDLVVTDFPSVSFQGSSIVYPGEWSDEICCINEPADVASTTTVDSPLAASEINWGKQSSWRSCFSIRVSQAFRGTIECIGTNAAGQDNAVLQPAIETLSQEFYCEATESSNGEDDWPRTLSYPGETQEVELPCATNQVGSMTRLCTRSSEIGAWREEQILNCIATNLEFIQDIDRTQTDTEAGLRQMQEALLEVDGVEVAPGDLKLMREALAYSMTHSNPDHWTSDSSLLSLLEITGHLLSSNADSWRHSGIKDEQTFLEMMKILEDASARRARNLDGETLELESTLLEMTLMDTGGVWSTPTIQVKGVRVSVVDVTAAGVIVSNNPTAFEGATGADLGSHIVTIYANNQQNTTIIFPFRAPQNKIPRCAFLTEDGWSSEGCTTRELSKQIECDCTHLSTFAVVMEPGSGPELSKQFLKVLYWVAGVFSTVGFLVVALMHVCLKNALGRRWYITLNISVISCVGCLAFTLLFVAELGLPEVPCGILSFLGRWAVLCAFFWLNSESIYSLNRATDIVAGLGKVKKPLAKMVTYTLVSYISPAAILALCEGLQVWLAAEGLQYPVDGSCWASKENNSTIPLIAPIIMMILSCLLSYIRVIIKVKRNTTPGTPEAKLLRGDVTKCWVSFLVLYPIWLGAWTFHVVSFYWESMVPEYAFLILLVLMPVSWAAFLLAHLRHGYEEEIEARARVPQFADISGAKGIGTKQEKLKSGKGLEKYLKRKQQETAMSQTDSHSVAESQEPSRMRKPNRRLHSAHMGDLNLAYDNESASSRVEVNERPRRSSLPRGANPAYVDDEQVSYGAPRRGRSLADEHELRDDVSSIVSGGGRRHSRRSRIRWRAKERSVKSGSLQGMSEDSDNESIASQVLGSKAARVARPTSLDMRTARRRSSDLATSSSLGDGDRFMIPRPQLRENADTTSTPNLEPKWYHLGEEEIDEHPPIQKYFSEDISDIPSGTNPNSANTSGPSNGRELNAFFFEDI